MIQIQIDSEIQILQSSLMSKIFEYTDHLLFLKKAFENKRSNKNRPQSLRAIAKKIDLSPAYLSKVLNKKQGLSTDAALKISEWIDLSPSETEYLLLLIKASQEKNELKQLKIQNKINSHQQSQNRKNIQPEVFEKIANVNYLTTLLLMGGKHSNIDPIDLAGILNLELKTSIEILETLEKCKLVSKIKNRYHRNDNASLFFESKVSNSFLREIYKEMLLSSITAIDNEPIENRTIGCEFMLIDQEQIPALQKIINDCFTKAVTLSHQAKTKDHVYNLGIQLVKLTKGNL